MIQLELNDEEAKVLRSVIDNYTAHLEVEIHRTERTGFQGGFGETGKGAPHLDRAAR